MKRTPAPTKAFGLLDYVFIGLMLAIFGPIIENQYLFIAHEVGWPGLALFVALFVMILVRLWKFRSDWLALGVLASGIGLALIGLLLPVWADDTVSIIWWGLAGLAIGGTYGRTVNKTTKRAA